MQVFKLFMLILKKKLPVLLIFVVVFMVLCTAFTMSGDKDTTFEESKVSIVLTDNDNTPESKALADYIGSRQKIVHPKMAVKDALFFNQVSFALTINEGYADKLAKGETDELFTREYVHEGYGSAYMGSFLDEYVSCVRAAMLTGDDLSAALKSAESAMDTNTEVTMISAEAGKDVGMMSGNGFFRYLPYVILSVMIMSLSSVMIAMNSREVRFRTNCSAMRPTAFVMQLLAGSILFVAAVWVIFMILGAFLNGSMYSGREWLQVLNSAVFAIVSALTAMMISLLLPSVQTINIVSNVVCLVMSFMCGVFVPRSMLSSGVLTVGRFMPMYWYTKANDMLAGVEIYSSTDLARCLGIEACFAAALAAVTMLIYKLKIRSNEN